MVLRHEHAAPGAMPHLHIERLGRFAQAGDRLRPGGISRGAGWEHVPVAIDDHARVGFARATTPMRVQPALGAR
jgi:hypothetical protein